VAFVLQQSWHGVEEPPSGRPLDESALVGALAGALRGDRVRQGAGTVLTVAVHIVLLWVLATRLVGEGEGKAPAPVRVLQFDLAAAAGPPVAAAPAAAAARAPEPALQDNAVDTSARTDLPPPEWSVSRIAMPPAAPSDRPTVEVGGSQAGAGAGGRGAYDPYAGAAPLPLNRATAPAPPAAGALILDTHALAAVRQGVERRLAACRGTIVFSVRVSPTGVVLDAAARGGTAAPAAVSAVRGALLGKPLFRGRAAGAEERQLPEIMLCR
jgi:hypothetical protein